MNQHESARQAAIATQLVDLDPLQYTVCWEAYRKQMQCMEESCSTESATWTQQHATGRLEEEQQCCPADAAAGEFTKH